MSEQSLTERHSENQLYVVLGMHRSGTSALSRALKVFNIDHGDNLVEAGFDNVHGFWETWDIVHINDKVLATSQLYWDSPGYFSQASLSSEEIQPLLMEAAELIKTKLQRFHQWCFKDPRTIRVLPFWLKIFEMLSVEPKFLLVKRNPLDVAESLKKRDQMPIEKGLLLWFLHNYP
ncbi:MAG: sulfotransferase family protein [Gammaproteobacteria bacterium]